VLDFVQEEEVDKASRGIYVAAAVVVVGVDILCVV
jgi:hypothetical protein